MILALLAAFNLHGYSLVDIAKAILVICGIVAIVYVILKVIDVWPPPWLLHILLIIAAIIVGIIAIDIIASL